MMRSTIFGFISFFLLVLIPLSYAARKEVKLTTYYPAPSGDYRNLSSTDDTYLATSNGHNVGVGTMAPGAKLDVKGQDASNAVMALQARGNAGTGLVVTNANRVGIGTNSPKGILDLTSNATAFFPPRVTTAQRNAIASTTSAESAKKGAVIYNTETNVLETYDGNKNWKTAGGEGGLSVYTGYDTGVTTQCPDNSGTFTGNWVCQQLGKTCVVGQVNVSQKCTANLDCAYYGGPSNTGDKAIIYCR